MNLHAKYYRFGTVTFVGSANLTAAALDWRPRSNLEVLVEELAGPEILRFEADVLSRALPVDDALYERTLTLVEGMRAMQLPVLSGSASGDDGAGDPEGTKAAEQGRSPLWLPESRTPQVLYEAYRGEVVRLSDAEKGAALADLEAFSLPKGLEDDAFRAYVGWHLAQLPVVRRIDGFVSESRRFGAVRAFLRRMDGYPQGRDPSRDWQTIMRWLLYFFPHQYRVWEANYSEIFVRVPSGR